MSHLSKATLYIFIILFLIGCNGNNPEPSMLNLQDVHMKSDKNGNIRYKEDYRVKDSSGRIRRRSIYQTIPTFDKNSNSQYSIKGKKKPTIVVGNNKVKISVESIPLNKFIDLVFGSIFKLNYSVSASVKKMNDPITLNMQKAEDANKVFEVVKKILAMNGVSVSSKNGMIFITKSRRGKKMLKGMGDVFIAYGRSLPNNLDDQRDVILFVPYYYVDPKATANLITRAGLSDLRFYYYINGIQTIFGKAKDVRDALRLIDMLDRPFLQGQKSYLVNLENIDVNYFVERLKRIFALNGVNVVDSPSKGGIVLYPIKELNSVYVITPKNSWFKMVLYWKKRLDRLSDTKDEPRIYIYHVRYRKAKDLQKAVEQVLGLTATKSSKMVVTTSSNKDKKESSNLPTAPIIEATSYTPTVTADMETNSLVFKLTPSHYKKLLPYIKELDKLPLQVLVEVTVAEVTLTNSFRLGFEYAIRNYDLGVPAKLDMSIGGSGLGVVFRGNRIDAAIDAFAQKKLLSIISRPKILILNNKTGSINIGTQVPIVTSEASAEDLAGSNKPTINRNINYRDTGVTLGLTPTINSNGVVTMNIAINLSEAQLNDTSKIDSPMIVNRTLNTSAVIRSGDTILIGGLISQNSSKGKSGVPGLMSVPVIGDLFSSNADKRVKTELIMLIRPTIIHSSQEMREATYKYETLLKSLNRLF